MEPRLCLTCWCLVTNGSSPMFSKDYHSKEQHSITNTFQVMAVADGAQIVNLCKAKDRFEHLTGMVSLFKIDIGFERKIRLDMNNSTSESATVDNITAADAPAIPAPTEQQESPNQNKRLARKSVVQMPPQEEEIQVIDDDEQVQEEVKQNQNQIDAQRDPRRKENKVIEVSTEEKTPEKEQYMMQQQQQMPVHFQSYMMQSRPHVIFTEDKMDIFMQQTALAINALSNKIQDL